MKLLDKLEKNYTDFMKIEKKDIVLTAIFFSIIVILMFNPIEEASTIISEFSRQIGIGIISNYDCAKIISNFSNWFILFAICFMIFLFIETRFKIIINTKTQQETDGFIKDIVILGIVNIVLSGITFFSNSVQNLDVLNYSIFCIINIIVLAKLFIFCGRKKSDITFDVFLQLLICNFGISYPISFIVFGSVWDVKKFVILQLILGGAAMALVEILAKDKNKKLVLRVINSIVIPCSLIPFLTSFYIEFVNILNQYEVFISNPLRIYCIIIFVFILLFSIMFYKKKEVFVCWKNWAYPFYIIGITCLGYQLPLQKEYYVDIFESANYSVLISDFLNFGKIPLVEHYGGHMLESVFEGIIYGVVNLDYVGAAVSPYADYVCVPLSLMFFYLVKEIWNDDVAIWTTLLIPFLGSWRYYAMGMIVVYAIVSYIKKNTHIRAIIVWFAIIGCLLYKLDTGMAFAIAGIVTLVFWIVSRKKLECVKQLLIPFVIIMICGCSLWGILCIIKNINPLVRLLEFLSIGLSNGNWALASIGDTEYTVFSWCYLFLPVIVLSGLLFLICSSKFRNEMKSTQLVILMMLGISYFANFSRGLVRHSVLEGVTYVAVWCAYVFIAVFLSVYKKNGKLFLVAFIGLVLVDATLLEKTNYSATNIADSAIENTERSISSWTEEIYQLTDDEGNVENVTYWEKIARQEQKVKRVNYQDDIKNMISKYGEMVDVLLDENETFIDFINVSFVYSALEKENPVYVSQSPLQLSGEYTQEQFIKQISDRKKNLSIVFMPIVHGYMYNNLDGISNNIRYYKVAEYIYDNYRPLCSFDDCAIWCLNERYEELSSKLKNINQTELEYEMIDWGYDSIENGSTFHIYDLKQLPYIWANFDEKEAICNELVSECEKATNDTWIISDSLDRDINGNYLKLKLNSSEELYVTLKMGELGDDGVFNEKYRYNFEMIPGENEYLIRISSDYYWIQSNINAIQIESPVEYSISDMDILNGD